MDCVHRSPTIFKLKQLGQFKKPSVASRELEAMEGEGGAGENRTPVQTSNENAFYMFSFRLIFDAGLTENSLTSAYLLQF